MIPTEAVAATVERHTSSLPASSPLVGKWTGLAAALRGGSERIADARVREFIAKRRWQAENLARWIEARDAKLRRRR
jgi:predicted transcriptional regulator